MAVMKEINAHFENVYDLAITNPTSEQLRIVFHELAETFGFSVSTAVNLYNEWVVETKAGA